MVVSWVEGSYHTIIRRLFIIQMGGDDAIKNFEINKSGVFGRGIQRN